MAAGIASLPIAKIGTTVQAEVFFPEASNY